MRYWRDGTTLNTWKCSGSSCTECESNSHSYCSWYTLDVEGGGVGNVGCKDGDKVRLVRQGGLEFSVYEIAVFLKLGEIAVFLKLGEIRRCLDSFYCCIFCLNFQM